MTTDYIRSGKVLFPERGVKILEDQIVSFGVEKYDDLADAFSQLMLYIIENNYNTNNNPGYIRFG